MKKQITTALVAAMISSLSAQTATPPNSNPPTINFDKTKDLFVAQFDSKPDPDDLQAIAAVGSMLAHPDLHNVDYYAVQGTVGKQTGGANQENNSYIRADSLMDDAFGPQNVRWTQAGLQRRNTWPDGWNGNSNSNWTASVTRVRNKAKTALDRGGKIYVMEAGNSDFTHDWVQELVANTSYTTANTKQRIVVVQHSNWNEQQTTTAGVLNWVRNNTDYRKIGDGNGSGGGTPGYKNSSANWINSVRTNSNSNAYTRNLWNKAWQAYQGLIPSWSPMGNGLADFSDTVEAWYIFNIGSSAGNVNQFVSRYVTSSSSTGRVPGPLNGGGGNPGGGGAPINQTVAFKASGNGKYVASDSNLDAINWPLVANRGNVGGSWEKFKIVDAGGGKISILATGNNKFVASDRNLDAVHWRLFANRGNVGGSWEKFTWITNTDGSVSLRAAGNNRIIASDRNLNATHWPLAANRDDVGGSWEKFTVQNQ